MVPVSAGPLDFPFTAPVPSASISDIAALLAQPRRPNPFPLLAPVSAPLCCVSQVIFQKSLTSLENHHSSITGSAQFGKPL